MPILSRPTLSIVIPARHQAADLAQLLPALDAAWQVVVVDCEPGDETIETLDVVRGLRPDAILVEQTRTGVGNALVCGFAAATNEVIVTLEPGSSADPADIPRLVDQLVEGAEFVKGSRFAAPGGQRPGALREIGGELLNTLANVGFGAYYSDISYGVSAFWRDLVRVLDLPSPALPRPAKGMLDGDGVELNAMIALRFAALGARIIEVPVRQRRESGQEPDLRTFPQAVRVLRTIAAEHRRALRSADAGLRTELADGGSIHLVG